METIIICLIIAWIAAALVYCLPFNEDGNVIWLYAGGAKWFKTFNLHKRLLKARKMGLNANPHLRKTNVSTS